MQEIHEGASHQCFREGQGTALMTGLCFGVINAGFREASQPGSVLRC
jgi:hypothetical protein